MARVRLGLARVKGGGESPRCEYVRKLSLGKGGYIEDIFLAIGNKAVNLWGVSAIIVRWRPCIYSVELG